MNDWHRSWGSTMESEAIEACPETERAPRHETLFDFRSLEVELRSDGELDAADIMREYADAVEADDYLKERLTMRRVREVTSR